jgi:hypothetical protein
MTLLAEIVKDFFIFREKIQPHTKHGGIGLPPRFMPVENAIS